METEKRGSDCEMLRVNWGSIGQCNKLAACFLVRARGGSGLNHPYMPPHWAEVTSCHSTRPSPGLPNQQGPARSHPHPFLRTEQTLDIVTAPRGTVSALPPLSPSSLSRSLLPLSVSESPECSPLPPPCPSPLPQM